MRHGDAAAGAAQKRGADDDEEEAEAEEEDDDEEPSAAEEEEEEEEETVALRTAKGFEHGRAEESSDGAEHDERPVGRVRVTGGTTAFAAGREEVGARRDRDRRPLSVARGRACSETMGPDEAFNAPKPAWMRNHRRCAW